MRIEFFWKKLHKRNLKQNPNRGSILPGVVVLIAILILLGFVYFNAAFSTFQMGKVIANGDMAYFGAEAAAERWYSVLRAVLTGNVSEKPTEEEKKQANYIGLDFELEYGKEREYVLNVLERIRIYGNLNQDQNPYATKYDEKSPYHAPPEKKQSSVDGKLKTYLLYKFAPFMELPVQNNSMAYVRFSHFEVYDAKRIRMGEKKAGLFGLNKDQPAIRAEVGFVLLANVRDASGKTVTANRRIYIEKEIFVPYYEKLEALGPLYSVGDLLVKGDETKSLGDQKVDIKGDIYSFGTFPSQPNNYQQWGYGGVLAFNNVDLNIYGSVFTRSMLRTGEYIVNQTQNWKEQSDTTKITVMKDVFAQGIQTFQKGSDILIYGDAYTLDDVEINSDNSMIYVNGNFIGLDAGSTAPTHDTSSAVLQSAINHYQIIQEPTTSRIVINGDIIIPGAVWKLDKDGTPAYTIEAAGLIVPKENQTGTNNITPDIPLYKYFELNAGSGDKAGDTESDVNTANYLDYISTKNGYSYKNLIQAFPVYNAQNFFENDPFKKNSDIKGNVLKKDYNNSLEVVPDKLSGYANAIVGANDRVYANRVWKNNPQGEEISSVTDWRNLTDFQKLASFHLDGFLPSEMAKVYAVKNQKQNQEDLLFNETTYVNEADVNQLVDDSNSNNSYIKDKTIKDKTKSFWKNYWEFSGNGNDFFANMFNNNDSKLSNLKALITNRLHQIATRSYPLNPSNTWEVSINNDLSVLLERIEILSKRTSERTSGVVTYKKRKDKNTTNVIEDNIKKIKLSSKNYVLIGNDDPFVDYIIEEPFYGILVTRGRVILKRGAKVYGTIIATGRKYDKVNDVYTDGTLNDSNSANLNRIQFSSSTPWNLGDTAPMMEGKYAGIIIDLTQDQGDPPTDPPTIDFYLGATTNKIDGTLVDFSQLDQPFRAQLGRLQLIEKFKARNVNIEQLF